MNKLREKAGDGTWLGDLGELLEIFYSDGKIAPWVKWSALFLSGAAALVVGSLLLVNHFSGVAPSSNPTPNPTVSETATATPQPTPTPTETPAAPALADELLSRVPGAWEITSLEGCKQAWRTATEGISSVAVLSRATDAFNAAGFTSRSAWGSDHLSIEAAGNQNGITSAEIYFTTESMTLCLR